MSEQRGRSKRPCGYRVGDEVVVRLRGTCVEGRRGVVAAAKTTEEGEMVYMIDLSDPEPPGLLQTLNLPAEELDHVQ